MSPPDLARVADDLDHIRALGGLAQGRRESLRVAAAELRALAALRNGRGPLVDSLRTVAAEVAPLLAALTPESRP